MILPKNVFLFTIKTFGKIDKCDVYYEYVVRILKRFILSEQFFNVRKTNGRRVNNLIFSYQ